MSERPSFLFQVGPGGRARMFWRGIRDRRRARLVLIGLLVAYALLMFALASSRLHAQTLKSEPHPLLTILDQHYRSEGEFANVIRVNPRDFAAAVQRWTGQTAPAGATEFVVLRVVADPAVPRRIDVFDLVR